MPTKDDYYRRWPQLREMLNVPGIKVSFPPDYDPNADYNTLEEGSTFADPAGAMPQDPGFPTAPVKKAVAAPAQDEPIDFAALGAEPGDEPLDFAALGAGESARELANHRWAKRIEQRAQVGSTEVFPFGASDTGSGGIMQAASGVVNFNRPNYKLPGANPMQPLEGKGIPDIPTVKPYAAEETTSAGRFGYNVGAGVVNIAPMTVNFIKNAIQNPQETAKDLLKFVGTVGKAGVWAAMGSGRPDQIGESPLQMALRARGIGPEELEKALTEDPVNTLVGIIAPIIGGLRGGKPGAVTPEVLPPQGQRALPPGTQKLLPGKVEPNVNFKFRGVAPETLPEAPGKVIDAEVVPEATPEAAPSGAAPEAPLDPMPNRRTDPQLRQAIVDEVTQMRRGAQKTYLDAVAEISRMAEAQEISGAQESAMLREAQRQYSESVAPPVDEHAGRTGQELTQQDIDALHAEAAQIGVPPEAPGGGIPASDIPESPIPLLSETPRPLPQDPYISQMVTEMLDKGFRPDEVSKTITNLGGDPAAYTSLWENRPRSSAIVGEEPVSSNGLDSAPQAEQVKGGSIFDRIMDSILERVSEQSRADIHQVNRAYDFLHDFFTNFSDLPFVKTAFGTLPQFFKMKDTIPDMYGAFVRKIAAADDALTAGTEKIKNGLDLIVPQSDRYYGLLGKYFIDQRVKGMRANGLTGMTAPELTTSEAAALRSDPRFAPAMEHYDNVLRPEIEAWNADAKMARPTGTPDNRYMPLIQVTEANMPSKGTWVVDAQGNLFQWDRAHAQALRASGSGSRRPIFRKQQTRFARRAKGTGEMWIADPGAMFFERVKDGITRARHNQLIDVTRSYSVDPANIGKDGRIDFQGKRVRVKPVDVRPFILNDEGKVAVGSSIQVPAPIADAYLYAMNPVAIPDLPGFAALNKVQVSTQLAWPAEAIIHSLNVATALERQPGLGRGPISRMVAQDPTSFGRWMTTMAEIVDQSGPKLAKDIRRLSTNGAVRASLFAEETTGLHKVWGIKQLKEGAFDYPNLRGKGGIRGFETRARVAMLRLLDREMGHLSDAQKCAIINNEFGTYVRGLQPTLVQLMRKTPILGDPFAAAFASLTKGAFKSLGGKSGLPYRPRYIAETLAAVWLPAILLPIVANKILNGEWEWDLVKKGKKPGDIRLLSDKGRTIDVPFRLVAGSAARGIGVFGGKEVAADIMRGRATVDGTIANALQGAGNTLFHRIGIQGRGVKILATGRNFHITPSGEFMEVAEPSITNKAANRISSALTGSLPITEQIHESREVDSRRLGYSEHPAAQATLDILDSMGLGLTIGSPEREQAGSAIRKSNAEVMDLAWKVALEARAIKDPAARSKYINERIENDFPKDKSAFARQQILKNLRQRQRSINRSFSQSGQ